MSTWPLILAAATAPAVLIAAAAYIVKLVLDNSVKYSLDKGMQQLEHANARELERIKGAEQERLLRVEQALGLAAAADSSSRERQRLHDARMRATAGRLARPTLSAAQGLARRIQNILAEELHTALRPDFEQIAGWSMTHSYAMTSTLYVFAKYFACVERIRADVGEDLFDDAASREKFFARLLSASGRLSTYPLEGLDAAPSPPDAQLFNLDQAAIGGAVMVRSGDATGATISFYEFAGAWRGSAASDLKSALVPLATFLEQVTPVSGAGTRLRLFCEDLGQVVSECRLLLDRENGTTSAVTR